MLIFAEPPTYSYVRNTRGGPFISLRKKFHPQHARLLSSLSILVGIFQNKYLTECAVHSFKTNKESWLPLDILAVARVW